MKSVLKKITSLLLIVVLTLTNINAQCGVKITSAVTYSAFGKSSFKAEFKNTSGYKTISAIEFKVTLLDSFDDVIGYQNEIWESGGIDEPIKPGEAQFILRVIKSNNVSRVKVSVVRVRYDDATKCYE